MQLVNKSRLNFNTYNVLSNKFDQDVIHSLTLYNNPLTGSNSLKLFLKRSRLSTKFLYFAFRIVNIWNSWPNSVILAPNVNIFKNKIDAILQKSRDLI